MAGPVDGQPAWFTPERMLVIFCAVNLLNYIDRGTIASNGVNGSNSNTTCNSTEACSSSSGIQGDFDLSNFEDGFLSSAFMVGLLIASPIFAHLSKVASPFKLIGVGLLVWTLATAGCGFSVEFWTITIARMLVGVGEASFVSLAAPFVIDNAPQNKRTAWLSYFYMCIPVGYALGYVYGGMVGGYLHWRVAFWGEAVLMVPFVIFCFVSRPILMIGENGGRLKDEQQKELCENDRDVKQKGTLKILYDLSIIFLKDMRTLFQSATYAINVLGYIVFTFVLGAYSYWGPRAGYSIYNLENADLVFGGVTVICGIFGTVAGGLVLDAIGSTIPNSFKLLSITTFIGATFCLVSFLSRTLWLFIPLFSLGELFIFATQGPVNFLTLECISTDLRPLAMAVSTVCIHVFGDVPSSPLVGLFQDSVNNWRTTTLVLTAIFFLASFLWFLGCLLPVDNSLTDGQDGVVQTTQMKGLEKAPLLNKV
ncbi:hypothetical protein KP509_24G080900 [Ceratopteris richardii]|uniref:Major facilitator superfamily (MFS) profile domain-containing protein n=1 Tax=Ceratopteris richardii TaxID=49495 RepID=A0A8T2RWI4_CERRI|nr:hypothetical protein KP509_24G080900 [Ceratopteris richardii]KAH7300835.1 hypothetical protein KP509_24G080900 [Ceratopteris richardii]KAH7300836.1 hypothetical protein KP509_24G080900 [Ceratopteris richardii]KAH7300837.1 hypothetical protein KP509_24G080900 [Ceratopteris richardii]